VNAIRDFPPGCGPNTGAARDLPLGHGPALPRDNYPRTYDLGGTSAVPVGRPVGIPSGYGMMPHYEAAQLTELQKRAQMQQVRLQFHGELIQGLEEEMLDGRRIATNACKETSRLRSWVMVMSVVLVMMMMLVMTLLVVMIRGV